LDSGFFVGALDMPAQQFRRPGDEVFDRTSTCAFSLSYGTAQSSSLAECDLCLFSSIG